MTGQMGDRSAAPSSAKTLKFRPVEVVASFPSQREGDLDSTELKTSGTSV